LTKKNNGYNFDNVYIIIPLYNEEQVLNEVISDLNKNFSNIIVVDDGSNDKSNELLQNLNVTLITHPLNLGQGAAIKTAFEYVQTIKKAYAIVTFDADGQHSTKDAVRFAKEIISCKEDIIFGSRFIKNGKKVPLLKRILLKFAILATNIMTKVQLTDTHNGLKAIKTETLKRLNLSISGYAFESQIVMEVSKAKIPYKEMPTNISYTKYSIKKGQSIRNSLLIAEDLFYLLRSK
jgi:glycosyltransferase involved in cell wall biosynthesis